MLKEKLMDDLKQSMKDKNEVRKNTIQMVRAAILQFEKDKGETADDNKIIELIAKDVKSKKDALVEFEKGGREDLVNQTNEEMRILQEYLPKQLSVEEIREGVKVIIEQLNATSMKDMGPVMKEAKAKFGASADGKTINEVVKEFLS